MPPKNLPLSEKGEPTLELRPFSENSCEQLISWIPDARFLLQWGGPKFRWPLDKEQLMAIQAETQNHPSSSFMFDAFDVTQGLNIGHIELMRVNAENRSAHIGRVIIDPTLRGKGFGSQLMEIICAFAFEKLALSRLTLGVFDFNQAAIDCYRQTGFIITETKMAFREYGKEHWDLVMMELSRETWFSTKNKTGQDLSRTDFQGTKPDYLANTINFQPTKPDIDDYWELFESTGWNKEYRFSRQELDAAISQSWRSLSAYYKKRLIGFGRIISDGVHHALIVDLMVLPEFQGCGIGKSILDKLLKECASKQIRDIQLFAAEGKYEFYEKMGFIKRSPDAPGMDYKNN